MPNQTNPPVPVYARDAQGRLTVLAAGDPLPGEVYDAQGRLLAVTTPAGGAGQGSGLVIDPVQRLKELRDADLARIASLSVGNWAVEPTDEGFQAPENPDSVKIFAGRTRIVPEKGLTTAELEAIGLTARLWDALCGLVGDAPTREHDLAELRAHIRAIQWAIGAQAAARAHPEEFRTLGGTP